MSSDWSIIISYYNEVDYLQACLECIPTQIMQPQSVILVNNASTDESPEIARVFKEKYDGQFEVILVDEPKPGKINALTRGASLVKTKYFATWDADTFYPACYLMQADNAYKRGHGRYSAVMATDLYTPLASSQTRIRRIGIRILSSLFRSECHAGGHSETFDTLLFRQAGGFDPERWPYVLEDHEIVEVVRKQGRVVYPWGLWCRPSKRRAGQHKTVSWTKKEKRIYRFSPACLKRWFFYRFLSVRLKRRGLFNDRLRERTW